MPVHEDSLEGESLDGEVKADAAEQSLGDEGTMGGDTNARSLGDQATFGDANVDDELFEDGMELVDLSTRYTEEGVLGKGGMGEVIRATDTRLGRKVAIKRILGKAARSKTAVARFLNEAQSMADLNHPNIVQIHDYGRSTDGPFLIMECVQGGSLLEKCKAGPIDPDEAVNIFGQLCDGLAKAHAVGIIHRDIKPANVLLTEDGIPKLTDFGLAKDDTADTGMTMEGAVIGTLDFMPPEQRQAAELTDRRSDLWSLAATFYQMLTGKSPKVINIAGLPPKLQSVVAKALEESKEDRFQSAMEMRESILQAYAGKMHTSRVLGEGECPECATPNPSGNKYCDECGSSLQVKCLNCESDIAIWNKACRECGGQQEPLLKDALQALQTKHDEAERLLTELMFDDALKSAIVIGEQDDPRLLQFATWHEEFSNRLESSRTLEHARLEELLREAIAHETAYDYESGLQTLKQVAPSLANTTINDNDTAEVLAERITTKQSRLKMLEATVRERVTKREIAGLLIIVDELLSLKPDRPDVQKLRAQLAKRENKLVEARDTGITKAAQQLEEQQYDQAVATLNTVSKEVSNDQFEELKTKANDLLIQLNNLRDEIRGAIKDNQFAHLLPIVEQCLILKSDQDEIIKLKRDLIARETRLNARNQEIISRAQMQLRQGHFDAAAEIIDTIATEQQTSSTLAISQGVAEGKAAVEKAAADEAASEQLALDKEAADSELWPTGLSFSGSLPPVTGSNNQTNSSPPPEPAVPTEQKLLDNIIDELISNQLAFVPGTYARGIIPEGEYIYITRGDIHYYSEEDLNGNILKNEIFESFGYVYVHGIGNIETRGILISLTAASESEIPSAKVIYEVTKGFDNYNFAGHYAIGRDLSPATYLLKSVGDGYYEISDGPVGNNTISENGIFKGNKQVSLKNGEYLKIVRMKIELLSESTS
jgi:serine/threonine protein kinase